MWIIGVAGKQSAPLQFQVMNFTGTLIYLNSSINPLIYCLTVRSLRVTIKNMIQTLACCRSQPQPPWFEFAAGEASWSLRVSRKMRFLIIEKQVGCFRSESIRNAARDISELKGICWLSLIVVAAKRVFHLGFSGFPVSPKSRVS